MNTGQRFAFGRTGFNPFLKGFNFYLGTTQFTETYVVNNFSNSLNPLTSDFTLENGYTKLKLYIDEILNDDGVNNLLNAYTYRDKGNIDFFIVDTTSKFNFNNSDGFEFFQTDVDYWYTPNCNNLGRQNSQYCNFKKRMFLPELTNTGSRNLGYGMSSGIYSRFYLPKISNFGSRDFSFSDGTDNKFANVTLYLDYDIWNGRTYPTGLQRFVDRQGTVVLIRNYDEPSTPTNLTVSSPTTSTLDVSFGASTSPALNNIELYEVFCTRADDPLSRYFYHQEIYGATSATINNLIAGKSYTVKVRAFDEYHNLSDFSNEIQITL